MNWRLAKALARKRKPSVLSIAAAMPQRRAVDSVTLVLPVPPSVNQLWAPNGYGGMRRTALYEEWIEDAGWQLVRQHPGRVPGAYDILIEIPVFSKADPDNLSKACCDLLQGHGVINNDRLAQSVKLVRTDGTEFRVTVTRVP